jgi:uncharacterized protein (DUF1015 family)
MAEVRALHAVHYDPARVEVGDVVAPPYDVIDAAGRAQLLERSPYNVVELDLPETAAGSDIYEHAAATMEAWEREGILARDSEPTIWAYEQDYTGPDGERRTRRGFLARIRVTEYGPGLVRPHERTQPGPKEDRLRLTRATAHSMSPIFILHEGDAWSHLAEAAGAEPWAETTDADGTVHRVWPIADRAVHEAIAAKLEPSELLIADGHHRYETARTYGDEIGGEGPHRYTLASLVSLEDPGLSVFATHRLLHDLDTGKQEAIRDTLMSLFDVAEAPSPSPEDIVPASDAGEVAFGYMDSHHRKPYHLVLRDTDALDAELEGFSEAYRRLDAAALEALILRKALGMSTDDIAAKRGLSYCSDTGEAVGRIEAGECDAGFLLRPTPVQQVRDVAAAGETMPPKSTFFFPKLLTGLVFNPLTDQPE